MDRAVFAGIQVSGSRQVTKVHVETFTVGTLRMRFHTVIKVRSMGSLPVSLFETRTQYERHFVPRRLRRKPVLRYRLLS